ncbi:MAG: hypothetical protein H0W72_03155 [Planctomycetes bacterium]|nr:hypothetical protein [Planctomycetota bacterium]
MRLYQTAIVLCLTAAAQAADPLAGMRFTDGKTRSLAQYGAQPVAVLYFCGHCPSARAMISKEAVAISAAIERGHLAAQLICVTPDLEGAELVAYMKEAAPALLDKAAVGFDSANPENVSLRNIYQARVFTDGQPRSVSPAFSEIEPMLRASRAWRYPVDGLEGQAAEQWWAVERGRTGALKAAIAAAKRDPHAERIVNAARTALTARQQILVDAPIELATVERLEELLAEGAGLDLKPAADRLKGLLKDPALKHELQARTIWRQCQDQLGSTKPKEREAGTANLAQLAAKLPDTVYGRRAGAPAR